MSKEDQHSLVLQIPDDVIVDYMHCVLEGTITAMSFSI